MNITVDKQPTCSATVKVVVPAGKVASERQELVKGYAKNASIKGFRPGKAPASVVEKRYEKEITGELFNKLINAGCDEAIKQEELNVLSVNVTEEPVLTESGELNFQAEIILSPEFKIPEYLGLEIEAPSVEVTDEDLTASIEDLRQRFAEFKDVERELTDGDFAVVDFTATTDGKPVAEAIGKSAGFLEGREGHWAKVEDDSFMPGFGSGLKGLKAGDKKEFVLTMPEEFPLSDVRGAEITFDVTVKTVKEQELPELNDEFAGKLMPDKGMDDLKEVIREQLGSEKERLANDAKVEQVVAKLGEGVEFELPQALVDQETQSNAMNMIERARTQGMTDEMIQEQEGEIGESAAAESKRSLKTNFILLKIAEKEDIQVEDQDVIQRISAMAEQAKKPVKAYIKELQKANAIQNVRNSVLIGKTIDFVVGKSTVTEVATTETTDAE